MLIHKTVFSKINKWFEYAIKGQKLMSLENEGKLKKYYSEMENG